MVYRLQCCLLALGPNSVDRREGQLVREQHFAQPCINAPLHGYAIALDAVCHPR